MKSSTRSLGHAAAVILGAGGLFFGAAGTAAADPVPGCTAADVTAVMSGVSTSMTAYLFTHPDVNNFFTSLQGQKKGVAKQRTKDYLAANPQVRGELEAIRAPGVDLRNRCNIPLNTEITAII